MLTAQMRGHPHPGTRVQLLEEADFVKALHEVANIAMREGELPLVWQGISSGS